MMEKRGFNRWAVVIGGIICQFCAGMFYSWSLYVTPLVQQHQWEKNDVTLTFSIATVIVPIAMIIAGKYLPRFGPTKTALVGAASLTVGLFISGTASSLLPLYLGYGILGGCGVGSIYGVALATSVKWFPDKKGLISGLSVSGFGLGSIIFAPVCTVMIQSMGVHRAFLVQGGITLVGMALGAPMMKAAPDGFAPAGWTPPAAIQSVARHEYPTSEMLRRKEYWFILFMYFFANMAGLLIIGHASPISQEIAGLTFAQGGAIVSALAIANTVGRFLGGAASDKLGAARVVTILYIIDAALLFTLKGMTSFTLIALGISGLAVCFGAMMGAYPSLVLDYFGGEYYSANYGFIFLAFGMGGLAANQVATLSLNRAGNYNLAFLIVGGCCAVGMVMSLLAKAPVYKGPTQKEVGADRNGQARGNRPTGGPGGTLRVPETGDCKEAN